MAPVTTRRCRRPGERRLLAGQPRAAQVVAAAVMAAGGGCGGGWRLIHGSVAAISGHVGCRSIRLGVT